ncbi:MAG: hypothetical protein AAFY28_06045 [Actinomycetota bacterium]
MTPAFLRVPVLATAATMLVSCGHPWQPLTDCPEASQVADVTGIAGLDLLDTSTTGELADFMACNYDIPALDSEVIAFPRVTISQLRNEMLKTAEGLDQPRRTVAHAIESPVPGAVATVSGRRAVRLLFAFDDGRISLQYIQPIGEPPLSDRDASARASQLALLAGLRFD